MIIESALKQYSLPNNQPWDTGIYSMAISQSKRDKFPSDGITVPLYELQRQGAEPHLCLF